MKWKAKIPYLLSLMLLFVSPHGLSMYILEEDALVLLMTAVLVTAMLFVFFLVECVREAVHLGSQWMTIRFRNIAWVREHELPRPEAEGSPFRRR